MILLLSIVLVIAAIGIVMQQFKIAELKSQLRPVNNIKQVNVGAIIADLDAFRKVAKGYEVAGIKKAIKIVTDHGTVKE